MAAFNQDFPGVTSRVAKLSEELHADSTITTTINSVQLNPSGLTGTRIVWNATPSGAEQTTASAVVAAHDATPPVYAEVGPIKQLLKTNGDVTVTATTFTEIAETSKSIVLEGPARVQVMVQAYGTPPSGGDLRLTIFRNGVNLAGAGGVSVVEGLTKGCLNATGTSGLLAAGTHTFSLAAKVSTGFGTVFASLASIPLEMTLVVVEGTP